MRCAGGAIPEGVILMLFWPRALFSQCGGRDGCQHHRAPHACAKSSWMGTRARAGLSGQVCPGRFVWAGQAGWLPSTPLLGAGERKPS